MADTFDPACLQPASYDLTVASDGLMTPDGTRVPPGSDGSRPRKITLRSGEAALLSTAEKFCMPGDVAGNVTIKNQLATEGLMLLSGLLIDPGYGFDEAGDEPNGCRLYLHVANIGKDPLAIRPGVDRIARVQFLPVHGDCYSGRQRIAPSQWKDQEQPALGFLTDLREVKEKVESTSTQVQYVVMLGFVVLGVTLIGVILATVLAIVDR